MTEAIIMALLVVLFGAATFVADRIDKKESGGS